MVQYSIVQCDVKLIEIDSFPVLEDETNATTEIGSVKVFLLPEKKSVKQYCYDTGLPFKEGLWKLYKKR